MVGKIALSALATLAVVGPPVAAQMPEPHHHDSSGQLGAVSFPTSCNAEAQRHFERGIAWLHSFEYEDAERSFLSAAGADPDCAMAHWGIAMSQYHPLWAPPTPVELEKGRQALAAALSLLDGGTPRERAYVDALATFFTDPAGSSHRDRTFAYEAAMERVHGQYPEDREAGVFRALAMIAAGMIDDDGSFARERAAAAILDSVFAAQPDHPGVAHYLIHSYDYPPLAHLALAAARRYASIAPASAHARHMPSHIFTRLGLWREVVSSNLTAEAAARAYAERQRLPGSWDERLHAMDYLAYAYLQLGQDGAARQVLDELDRIERVDPANFKVAYAFSAIPARIALERRQWQEAADLTLAPSARHAVRWAEYGWAEANVHFARAVGAARGGRPAQARQEIAVLAAIRQALAGAGGNYDWGQQVEIQRRIAAAWLDAAEGRRNEAVRTMRAAADLDDATEKHPVMPGSILPAREQLGELLLELGRPVEALRELEASLARAPGRLNSLHGAARAAHEAGEAAKAQTYFAALADLGCDSDGSRSAIAEARAAVAPTGEAGCRDETVAAAR